MSSKKPPQLDRATGKRSEYSPELADAICVRLVDGESLRDICADTTMPARSTVFVWLIKHPEFVTMYNIAREMQAEALVDEIIGISDDGQRDYAKDQDGRERVDHDHISRARLRVDSRKWFASKMRPKKYGEKLELSGDKNAPVALIIVGSDKDG